MSILAQSVINEIATEIAKGKICYIHRYTTKVTSIDPSIEDPKSLAAQEQRLAEVEKKIDSYVKIEKPNATNQLVIMERFLAEVSDRSVRKELSNALNRKKPARNFMTAVEGDMELNQHWRNFKIKEYQEWVAKLIIDAYNY